MRAPYQILAIPYRIYNGEPEYCVFHRADFDQWQFVSGGGEDTETPLGAAKREIFEETGVKVDTIFQLSSIAFIPTNIFPEHYLKNWSADTYVIPEYTFAFECHEDIILSNEHTEYTWLTYNDARQTLKWDSNKTALYEAKCIIEKKRNFADHHKDNVANTITYVVNKPVSAQKIADLRQSVGWNRMEACYRNKMMTSYVNISAYDGERMIGYVDTVSNNVTDAYIQDLMVHPDYQGKGIGTELMNRVIAYLKTHGIYMISVVFEERLKPFYKRFGFYEMLCGQLQTYDME
jgi:dATP pyrophosphohydrolase